MNKPILLAGLPRSGTTWVGEIVSSSPGIKYYYEPDNEKINTYSWIMKRDMHRFPVMLQSDQNSMYKKLWSDSLSGKINTFVDKVVFNLYGVRNIGYVEQILGDKTGYCYIDESMKDVKLSRDPFKMFYVISKMMSIIYPLACDNWKKNKRVVVKSVHSCMALEWIDKEFNPDIVVILRNPYALYASYIRLKMPDAVRNICSQEHVALMLHEWGIDRLPDKGYADEAAFQICFFYKLVNEQLKKNQYWNFVSHDRLCKNPTDVYQDLFKKLNLPWSANVIKTINDLNKEGDGFSAKRISKDQPDKWKNELDKSEIDCINRWISNFELNDFLEEYVL